MYYEFDDVRRIHQPYTDSFFRRKHGRPIEEAGHPPKLMEGSGPTHNRECNGGR